MYTIRRVETRRKPERKVISITELNLSIYSYIVAKLYLAIWVAAKRSRRSLNREIGGGYIGQRVLWEESLWAVSGTQP